MERSERVVRKACDERSQCRRTSTLSGRLGFFLRGMDLYDKFADEIIIFRILTYFCGDSQRRPGRVPVGMTAAAAS